MKKAAVKIPSIPETRVRDAWVGVFLPGRGITLSPEGDTDVTTKRTNDSGYATAWVFGKYSGCVCSCSPSTVPVCAPRPRESHRGGTPRVLSVFDQREKVLPFDKDTKSQRMPQ